jgi:hypothetical protein
LIEILTGGCMHVYAYLGLLAYEGVLHQREIGQEPVQRILGAAVALLQPLQLLRPHQLRLLQLVLFSAGKVRKRFARTRAMTIKLHRLEVAHLQEATLRFLLLQLRPQGHNL